VSGSSTYQQNTTARLEEIEQRAADHDAQLLVGAQRMARLEDAVAANTALTQQVHSDTADLVRWIHDIQGATRVLVAVGKLARPLGYLVAALAAMTAFWAAVKGHMPWGHKP
jgi:hypothetical protein